MILKNAFTALIAVTLLASSGPAPARPNISRANSSVLICPRPCCRQSRLGRPAQFAPVPIEASSDPAKPVTKRTAEARAEPKVVSEPSARKVRTARVHVESIARAHAEKRRGAARTKLAHRHSNPLDAEAFDRRIQVWPCKSGGICDWQR